MLKNLCTAISGSKLDRGGPSILIRIRWSKVPSTSPICLYSSHGAEAPFHLCIADWNNKKDLDDVQEVLIFMAVSVEDQ